MKNKILILANISFMAMVLSGCPSKTVQEKVIKQQSKQQMIKRSDQQFEDMEKQMNK